MTGDKQRLAKKTPNIRLLPNLGWNGVTWSTLAIYLFAFLVVQSH